MKKIFGLRFSLIGDIIMSLPILDYLDEKYNKYELYFSIAKKCSQASSLFINHPKISHIKISDYDEGLGEEDKKIMDICDIVFNVKPDHPSEQDWYNYRSCVEETALMAGLDPSYFSNKQPRLYQYWQDKENNSPTISIWPFAGYGKGYSRSPSIEWWRETINLLLEEKYDIIHLGAENEPVLSDNIKYRKLTNLTFFEQIQTSLSSNLIIGTDSGSMWVTASYHKVPQINLITNWLPNHHSNQLALAPIGEKTNNLFAQHSCSNIDIGSLMRKINEIFCI